jgi:hypothetical protein
MMWIDPHGYLVGGVYNNATEEVRSTSIVADGTWHLATLTYGPAGEALYLDGTLQSTNPNGGLAQPYNAYWHVGFSETASWPDAPTSNYFAGTLAHAAVFPSQLSASQVLSLYAATSLSSEEAAVLALGPSAYWPLTTATTSSICAVAQITVQASQGTVVTCLAPAASGPCGAPSASANAASALNVVAPNPAASSPVTLTTTMDVAGLTSNASGLRLLVPLTFAAQRSSFSATLSYASEVVIV